MKKLLLLSNSTNHGEKYMQWCESTIAFFLDGATKNIVFIPYAAVDFSYEEYTYKVNGALSSRGIQVSNIDTFEDKQRAIKEASAILVGGGNTFHLLKMMYEHNLVSAIQEAVNNSTPYVGWSAGSNVACNTICTTNDMPIVFPPSFNGLQLFEHQINPHYTEKVIKGHGGESRLKRLMEYLAANDNANVVCLPESTYLRVLGDESTYYGASKAKVLSRQGNRTLKNGDVI